MIFKINIPERNSTPRDNSALDELCLSSKIWPFIRPVVSSLFRWIPFWTGHDNFLLTILNLQKCPPFDLPPLPLLSLPPPPGALYGIMWYWLIHSVVWIPHSTLFFLPLSYSSVTSCDSQHSLMITCNCINAIHCNSPEPLNKIECTMRRRFPTLTYTWAGI